MQRRGYDPDAMLPRERGARNAGVSRAPLTLSPPRKRGEGTNLTTASLLENVAPRRFGQRRIARVGRADSRRRHGRPGARPEPRNPLGPPRALFRHRGLQPTIRVDVAIVLALGRDAIAPTRVAWLGDDAGVVTAAGEQKRYLGVGQPVKLVDRAPGRDVVGFGADREIGRASC